MQMKKKDFAFAIMDTVENVLDIKYQQITGQ